MGSKQPSSKHNTVNTEINEYLSKQKTKERHKILLLGTKCAGKSTIIGRMRSLSEGIDFIQEKSHICKPVIVQNIISSMASLIRKSQELNYRSNNSIKSIFDAFIQISLGPEKVNSLVSGYVRQLSHVYIPSAMVTMSEQFYKINFTDHKELRFLGKHIASLWELDKVQKTFASPAYDKSIFDDNMDYFFDKVEIIFASDFEPTLEDILKCHIETTGLIQQEFTSYDDETYQTYQLTVTHGQTKKWIHLFDNVETVVFVVALNHFNIFSLQQNMMHESIKLFADICNSKWFPNNQVELLFTKKDLLCESLRNGNSLKQCFHENVGWEGEQWNDDSTSNFEEYYDRSVEFIINQYIKSDKSSRNIPWGNVTPTEVTAPNYPTDNYLWLTGLVQMYPVFI